MTEKQKWPYIYMLLKLAETGAYKQTAQISTPYLAKKLNLSQQTASRYLIELEHKGWITRTITPDGSHIKIETPGEIELQHLHNELKNLLEATLPTTLILEGTTFTGLGEGAYYISKSDYKNQIIKKLGFEPYPGTLNIKLSNKYNLKTRRDLEGYLAVEVTGFQNETRSFGLVKCYPALIGGCVKGALVTALRSHYDDSVLELIAPVCLRKHLQLKDGSKVKVEICPSF
ncbi:MAG: DUF120 domain-containing protein [Nitrososphaerota archaeon]|nr:DUF120 domain-containing protein [Nitrososphaerota archaeon]